MPQRLSEAAREINDAQPAVQLQRVASAWRPLGGQRVHLLGLGFRPDVKVDTFSPAYALRDELDKLGAVVSIEDPHYDDAEIVRAGFTPGCADRAALIVLNTAHRCFAQPDFSVWRRAGVEAVLDGRNFWDQAQAEAAGLAYFGIGRAGRYEQR